MIKCWYFTAKVEIDQNVAVWLKNKELIRILKFEDNVGNRSKCWNLSAKCNSQSKCWNISENMRIYQNVEIWAKKRENDRKRERSNVYILLQKWESIKMLEFEKIRNWSEIWGQDWELIKMLKFEC